MRSKINVVDAEMLALQPPLTTTTHHGREEVRRRGADSRTKYSRRQTANAFRVVRRKQRARTSVGLVAGGKRSPSDAIMTINCARYHTRGEVLVGKRMF